MEIDPRIGALFRFTCVNGLLQAFVFEDWSLILVGTATWHLLVWAWLETSTRSARVAGVTWVRLAMMVPFLGYPCYWISRMPHTWESDLWSVQTDLVMALWLLLYGAAENTDSLSETLHEMFAGFYAAAGLWKFNSDFLDPKASCASVFLSQHVTYFCSLLPWESQLGLAESVLPFVPLGGVGVELAMALTLALGRLDRRFARLGLLFILYFHLWVCITPRPNNISLFAVQCASRLVIVVDPFQLEATGRKLRGHAMALSVVAALAVAYGVQAAFEPLNWSFVAYGFLFLFLHWAMVMEKGAVAQAPAKKVCRRPRWSFLATCFAWAYAFGVIMLGLMEEASCNMFANLKIHGGSNHLLLPTGLLFKWYREAGDAHPYGGGVVRMETTDSHWLQSIYPCDMTHVLTPRAAPELLEQLGIPRPSFLNSGANRILRLRERGIIPPPPHDLLLQYTTPALEWKRLLKEAMEKDRSFAVTYAHLPGVAGDEMWRATAYERRVELKVEEAVISECDVRFPNGTRAKCQPNDLPFNLEVPWWIQKIGMYHGYPILRDSRGQVRPSIQCFGP